MWILPGSRYSHCTILWFFFHNTSFANKLVLIVFIQWILCDLKKNNEKLPNFETPMISICYFVFPFAKKATCDAFVYLVYSWYHKYPILSHSKHTLYTYSHCHKKTIPFHIESFHSLYHWDGIFFLWILFEMTHTKHTHTRNVAHSHWNQLNIVWGKLNVKSIELKVKDLNTHFMVISYPMFLSFLPSNGSS